MTNQWDPSEYLGKDRDELRDVIRDKDAEIERLRAVIDSRERAAGFGEVPEETADKPPLTCQIVPGVTKGDELIVDARELLRYVAQYRVVPAETVSPLQVERDALCLVLGTLVRKLDAVHEDPRYKGVWESFMIHGGRYTEPTYKDELDRARAFLSSMSAS